MSRTRREAPVRKGRTGQRSGLTWERPRILDEGALETMAAVCTSNFGGSGRCRTPGKPFQCTRPNN